MPVVLFAQRIGNDLSPDPHLRPMATYDLPAAIVTDTVTLEIPADLAYYLKVACADSSGVWHQHWRDVIEGKRSDLDKDACVSLSRKAWALWELLDSQGV